jgi:flagellar motor switch protein FliN
MLKGAKQSLAAELSANQGPETWAPPSPEENVPEGRAQVQGKQKSPIVEKVEFAPFTPQDQAFIGHKKDLRFFNQIPLVISGELGKAYMTVRELLKLEEGSVIKLDKLAGESATVLINWQYVGLAEIVVIDERFGLRVTAVGQSDQQEEKREDEKKETESQPETPETPLIPEGRETPDG